LGALACLLALSVLGVVTARSAETPAPAAPAAPPAATAPEADPFFLQNLSLDWVNSDICRLIEEIRRTNNQWDRRDMVERIEDLIYKYVEYPLEFRQSETADEKERERIGANSDIDDAGSANPLASRISESFALYAIAKGYEGFAAAATDLIERARKIYPTVESLTVRIDNFQDQRPVRAWIKDGLGEWARTDTVRVTFEGRNLTQASVDKLGEKKDVFRVAAKAKNVNEYYVMVAREDFLRGVSRYLVTNERLTEHRPNTFSIYLPPGDYELGTESSALLPIKLEVTADPQRNLFVVETMENSLTVYAKPAVGKKKAR
jgi:hypothetical protein